MDRRSFLKLAGMAAAVPPVGALLGACGNPPTDTPAAASQTGATSGAGTGTTAAGPGTTLVRSANRKVKLGFIALTDCASIVMAKELGYFAERDLDVSVEKQASWAATRDNLLNNEIDGGHVLSSMPLSVATGIGGNGQRSLRVAMMLNNNGQAITLQKDYASVGYGDLEKVRALLLAKTPTIAMTFPGGTHDTWVRYWLKACKVDANLLKIITIPPAQMVANMKVDAMDGFCVGEPWNAQAVAQNIGFTHLTTQDMWKHHPEKALVVTEKVVTERPDVVMDLMGAILKASKWLDDLANRKKAAETIGAASYVNAPASEIEGRMLGKYDLGQGLGAKTYTDDYMTFFRGGQVNPPRRGHAIWFLSQYRRFGLLKSDPPFQEIADQLFLRDMYEKVAAKEGIPVPDDDMAPFTIKLDNTTFDPKKPLEEVNRV
jgi:nitrate/nitrite transport system substrate-binding protein